MKKLDPNKLASLSKEEKIKLYDRIQLKKRLALKKRDKFIPNTAQLPVLKSKAYIRLFAGGNGSGKSTLGVNAALAAADGYNPWTEEFMFAFSNPTKPDGEFADCFDKHAHLYRTRHVDSQIGRAHV